MGTTDTMCQDFCLCKFFTWVLNKVISRITKDILSQDYQPVIASLLRPVNIKWQRCDLEIYKTAKHGFSFKLRETKKAFLCPKSIQSKGYFTCA